MNVNEREREGKREQNEEDPRVGTSTSCSSADQMLGKNAGIY